MEARYSSYGIKIGIMGGAAALFFAAGVALGAYQKQQLIKEDLECIARIESQNMAMQARMDTSLESYDKDKIFSLSDVLYVIEHKDYRVSACSKK